MNLTTKQAASVLKLKPAQLRALVKKGQLAATNAKPGVRVAYTFDRKAIYAFKKASAPAKRPYVRRLGLKTLVLTKPDVPTKWVPVAPESITTRLTRIEDTVAQLLKIWS